MLRFGQALFSAEERNEEFTSLSTARERIAAGTNIGAVNVYTIVIGDHKPRLELVGRFEPPPTDAFLRTIVSCVKLSPCANYLAVGTRNGTVTVYSMRQERSVMFSLELQHNEHRGRKVTAIAWSERSERLFSGCEGGRLFEAVVASKSKGRLLDSFRMAGSFFGITNVTEIPDTVYRGAVTKLEYAAVQPVRRGVGSSSDVLVVASAKFVALYSISDNAETRVTQKIQGSDSAAYGVTLHQITDEMGRRFCKGLYISQTGGLLCYYSLDVNTFSSIQLRPVSTLQVNDQDLSFVDLFSCPRSGLLALAASTRLVVIDTTSSLFDVATDFSGVDAVVQAMDYVFVLHREANRQQISAVQVVAFATVHQAPSDGARAIHALVVLQRRFRQIQHHKRTVAAIQHLKPTTSPRQALLSNMAKLGEDTMNALVEREAELERLIFDQSAHGFNYPQRADSLPRFTSVDAEFEPTIGRAVDKCISATHTARCNAGYEPTQMLESCDHIISTTQDLLHELEIDTSDEDDTTSSNTEDEGLAQGHHHSRIGAERAFPMNGYADFVEAADEIIAVTQLVLNSSYRTVVVNDTRAAHLLCEFDELQGLDPASYAPAKPYNGSVRAMLDGVSNVLVHSKKITQSVNKRMAEFIEGVKGGIQVARSLSTEDMQALTHEGDLTDQDTAQPPDTFDGFILYPPMPQPDDAMLAKISARRSKEQSPHSATQVEVADIGADGVSAVPANQYELTLVAPRGIGLNLAILGNDLVVRDFNTLANGETSPAEQSGIIEIGDILVGVNGLDLRQLPLQQTVEILQRMNEIATDPITLRFMFADAVRLDADDEDFFMGVFEAMTTPKDLLTNGTRTAMLDTVDQEELDLRRKRHAARSMDEADWIQSRRSLEELVEGSTFQPARPSMMECIQEMKAQVKDLKRAQTSGWFDNDNFSRLLRDEETKASEFRQAVPSVDMPEKRPRLPSLLPHQSAALVAAFTAPLPNTRTLVSTPKRTALDHIRAGEGFVPDAQGIMFWFDQGAAHERAMEANVVDVRNSSRTVQVQWDIIAPIAELAQGAHDPDALISHLSNDLVQELSVVMAEERDSSMSLIAIPPAAITFQLVELLAMQTSLNNTAVEIDQLLQMWLRCFRPLPYLRRNELLESVQTTCGLSAFDTQQLAEATRDLVTIYFCLHTVWPWLDAGNSNKSNSNTCNDLTARVQRVCRLALFDFQLSGEPAADSGQLPAPSQWSESDASRFITQFGAYLRLDAVCIACNARRFSGSLDLVMQVAACDSSWQQASTKLGQLAKDGVAVVGARALLTALSEPAVFTFDLYVSSLLLHLGTLYRKDDRLATDACVLLYPAIRPWNVKRALLGNLAMLMAPTTLQSGSGESGHEYALAQLDETMRDWLWVARRKYHQFLNVVMRSRTDEFGHSGADVLEWLELSLILANSELDPAENANATQQRARKYIVSARHIVKHQPQYRYRAKETIECCRRHKFAEGALEVCKQSLIFQLEQSSQATAGLPFEHLLPVDDMPTVLLDTIEKLLSGAYPQDARLWPDVNTGLRLLWVVGVAVTSSEQDATNWLVEAIEGIIAPYVRQATEQDVCARQLCNQFAQAMAQSLGPKRALVCLKKLPSLLAMLERSFFVYCCGM